MRSRSPTGNLATLVLLLVLLVPLACLYYNLLSHGHNDAVWGSEYTADGPPPGPTGTHCGDYTSGCRLKQGVMEEDGNFEVPDFHVDKRVPLPQPGQEDLQLFRARLLDLHPTQLAVGMQQVAAKREIMVSKGLPDKKNKLEKFLRKNPLPVVRGPGDGLYIIDHHHLSSAMVQIGIQQAYCHEVADWSGMTEQEFWRNMVSAHYLWPHDEQGNAMDWEQLVKQLPDDVTGLRDDPYRSLAALVRKAGGYNKVWVPFTEFQWANHLRVRMPVNGDPDQPQVMQHAMLLAAAPDAAHLPGYVGAAGAVGS